MRYPGAPNDVGMVHPIIAAVAFHDTARLSLWMDSARYVHEALVQAVEQYAAHGNEEESTLEDMPAYDRMMDLAVIGRLLEQNAVNQTTPEMAALAETPCERTGDDCAEVGLDPAHSCWPCRIRHALGGPVVAAQAG